MSPNSTFHDERRMLLFTKTLTRESVEVINESKLIKPLDIIDNKLVQTAFGILYTVIFVLGILGNILVCYVVFKNKTMQTVTNLLITNLALSDILLCIFAVLLTPMYSFLGRWVFGRLLCHLVPYAQGTSVYLSTLTLTSIAIDRFFVIIYPYHPRLKLNTCIFIIVFIWLFSLVVTGPYGFFMAIQTTNNKTYYCEENWPSETSRNIFGVFTTVLQFLIPFLVIAVCYACVSIKLNYRARSKPGAKNTRREEAARTRNKRTNRMLISMVVIFGISWLPLNLINMLNDFYAQMTEWNYYLLSFFLAHSMAMASICYNPFLYAWLNENFRKEFKQVLPFLESPEEPRNCPHSGPMTTHNTDKNICQRNETIQETFLAASLNVGPSLKQRLDVVENKGIEIEMENIILKDKPMTATFHANKSVNLQIIHEESESNKPKHTSTI